jgi:hypothetical protein
MEILDDLVNIIIKGDCVLFAGAGVTQNSGGLSWSELIDYLIKKYNYSSPLLENRGDSSNNMLIMDDFFLKFDPKLVYETISERLRDIEIPNDLSNLMKLPWYTVFTTNYDTALEKALNNFQPSERKTRPIYRGNEFFLPGRHKELLCVKLMGSCDVPFGLPGSMVLTNGELTKSEKEKGRIFDELTSHAANLSFLFIGYSFDDRIFIKNLQRLHADLGKPEKKFYAIFRTEPTPQKRYILESIGVIILVSDLSDVTKQIYEKYTLIDPTNYSQIRLQIGEKIIPIDKKNIFDFLDNYNLVDYNEISTPLSPHHFFKGDTKGLYPYRENWHFKRDEINELVEVILTSSKPSQKKVICVSGNLGTGRTFTIKAAIYELIAKHNSVAIRLQKNAINSLPDLDQIKKFRNEVSIVCKNFGITENLRFIFWAEYTPDPELLLRFQKIAEDFESPLFLIFEEVKNEKYIEDLSKEVDLIRIDICDNIPDEKKQDLIKYLVETTRRHKFPESTVNEISRIVNEEKQFLPIVYRTLDPTKASVDQIIESEFSELYSDEKTKNLIIYCCISSCVNLEMPISVLLKVFRNEYPESTLSYDSIFDYGNKAYQFININPDRYFGFLLSVYHPIIAQKIVRLVQREKIDEYLKKIAEAVNIQLPIDAKFVGALFITKGVNNIKQDFNYYKIASTEKGLLAAFDELYQRQPARPIIHHYARLIKKIDPENRKAISILMQALPEPREKYPNMSERKANIQTTLAKFKWDFNKSTLLTKKQNDPELLEIFNLLECAQGSDDPNIHAYYIHAIILMDLFDYKEKSEEKIELLTAAMDKLSDGQSLLSDEDFSQRRRLEGLHDRIFNSILAMDFEKALRIAEEMASMKEGKGFYLLANRFYYGGHIEESLKYVDKSLDCVNYPINALLLKLKLNISSDNPEYEKMLNLIDHKPIAIERETWETTFYKGIIYTINGFPNAASRFFSMSRKMAPRDKKTKISEFWKESGKPKVFRGKIMSGLTDYEGKIYDHKIKGCESEIFFDPRSTKNDNDLDVGMDVQFELGFNALGTVAISVKPYDPNQTKIETFTQ